MSKPMLNVVSDDYPLLIEFSNLKDNSTQVHSIVDIDQPLFRPAPKIVVFEEYAPFAIHEKKLFFRNNDGVARRIKLIQPDTPFFEMSAPRLGNGEPLQQSKIAAGIEIYFVVKFKPQEVRDYAWDLVCCTEREKFIVPIRAIGTRPRITFPDDVNFGLCPVKSGMRKVLLVQNVGSSQARFTIKSLLSVYTCPGEEMVVESGASQMIELFFTPPTAHTFEGELEVEFTKGPKCYIQCMGAGKNIDVSLSTPSLALEPSYISLVSQKTCRIRNQSETPINFSWRSFYNEDDEEAERARLLLEIDRMEEIEHNALMQRVQAGHYAATADADADADPADDLYDDNTGADMPFGARAEEAALVRKYRNLRRALEMDPMHFVDDIFEISPVEGLIWANSELEITVSFRPDTAAMYTCLGFLDISGRQDRLTLNMSGQGIGPHATLSFDVLDVGDIFIHSEQRYEIFISNKGDIAAQWNFMSSLTRFGNKFRFSPTEGYLLPGQSQPLSIVFESDVLGEFCENFRFALQGNEDMLVCQIKGHVLGPTFHFDTTAIDFGTVSFDYLHSTNLRLVNSSKIAMVFNLHIPQDGTYLKKEFNLEPSEGTLGPGQHMDVLLEFIPSSVKLYDYSLAVDVLGIGDVILSVPISAECVVSAVSLSTREIEFGECFIRYPYEKVLTLTNLSDKVYTKFEILPQAAFTKATATYEAEPGLAVIEPSDSMDVVIRLVAEKLGQFKIPIAVSVAGSQEPPIKAVLNFSVVGPKVVVDQPDVRWGSIECLKDSARILRVTNDGLIQACLKLFLKQARSKFELPLREVVLEPQESLDLAITANLDDSVVIKDELHILVEESDNLMVPLSAKGIGTTISCGQDLKVLDMGTQLTNTNFEKRIILENKGRRPQFLKWVNVTIRDENLIRAEKAKKEGKEPGRLPKNLMPKEPLFTVTPEEITLRPRTATTFNFKGRSDMAGLMTETFVLESRVGTDRVMKPIIETVVQSDVVNPLLKFSEKELSFVHRWQRGQEEAVQRRLLVLTNSSAVPLSFVLKTGVPFNLNSWEHTLQPEESVDIEVEFDPLYRDEKVSHTVDKALAVAYMGHPQKDSILLKGEIIFPNLHFELKEIKFGCVLNDTNKIVTCRVTNCSKVETNYSWNFAPQSAAPGKDVARKSVMRAAPLAQAPVNFDILPIRSCLQPGETEEIQFTMLGAANAKMHATAICVVEGGPEYKLPISGESSTLAYALDKAVVDFGRVVVTERAEQDMIISNTGKVAFPFLFEFVNPAAAELIEISPMQGTVPAGEKLKVVMIVRPGLPEFAREAVQVRVAHFDPHTVDCYWIGIFPTCVVTLPRQKKIGPYGTTEGNLHGAWSEFLNLVTSNIHFPDEARLPPSQELAPPPASGDSSWEPVFETPREAVEEAFGSSSQSVAGTLPATSQNLLEVEMHRVAMNVVLARRISERRQRLAEEAAAASALAAERSEVEEDKPKTHKGKKTLSSTTAGKAADEENFQGLQHFIAKHIDMKDVVVANYLCDFGNVIIGQTRKRGFRVTNTSLVGQVNFVFDTSLIANNGFSIEPNKVAKMLENESADFVVKLTARTTMKVGKKMSVLPLINKGSPTLNIVLVGNVCIPEIDLSSDTIHMDKVIVGQSKKSYFRLHNTSPVTATWSFKKTAETRFTITPSEGSLRAGRKLIVCVEFIPTEARKATMETTFKIENNTKSKLLKVTGEGVGAVVKFDSNVVELGPVVPFTDGDSKVITLTNFSDFPVEVYSLDFDSVYREDDVALSKVELFDSANLYRSQPRLAGEALPEAVLAAVAAKEASAAAAAAAAALAAEGGEAADGAAVEAAIETPAASLEIAPVRVAPGPRDSLPAMHQDILVVGPPLSGVTSVAHKLSKKLQLPVRKIDQMLQDVGRTSGPEGSTVRRCTGAMTEIEAQSVQEQQDALLAAAEASKKAADDAFRADKKNKGKEPPEELLQTPEVAAHQAFVASGMLSVATLTALLKFRLSWEDAGYGMIVDGPVSAHASLPDCLQAVEASMPGAVVANVLVSGGEAEFTDRIRALFYAKTAEVDRLTSAMEQNKRAMAKAAVAANKRAKKSTKGVSHDVDALPADEVVYAVPTGDEPWVNQENGQIIELDSQDIKALEDHQKGHYNKQLLYYQHTTLQASKEVLAKITRIWSPELGLKTSLDVAVEAAPPAQEPAVESADAGGAAAADVPPTATEEATEEAVLRAPEEPSLVLADPPVLYCEYVDSVLPLLATMFKPPVPEAVAEADAEAHQAAAPEEDAPAEEQAATPAAPADCGVFDITIEGEETEEIVFATCMALLPPPKMQPADKDAVPPSCVYQVLRRPYPRSEPKTVKVYSIHRVEPAVVEAAEGEVEGVAAPTFVAPEPRSPHRWVIAPNGGTVQIRVLFKSQQEGKFDSTLTFEVLGSGQTMALHCTGICEVPKINGDSRNVFMRRVKGMGAAGSAPPTKRFAIAENLYSFGPLLIFKKPEWRQGGDSDADRSNLAMVQTNTDVVRISNNGRYRCTVELGYEDTDPESLGVFSVEPTLLELDEGETKDVSVWAFPKAVREYKNTLLACVTNNAIPVRFDVRCWGSEPTLDIIGPWGAAIQAAEEAVAACADKKLLKALEDKVVELKGAMTIDFDRLLVRKSDTRTFEVKNTSLMPVAWELDTGDFAGSENMSFFPLSGVLPVSGSQTITLTMTSPEPLLVTGKFGLKFSDNERGLAEGRAIVRSFRAVGEAYKIQAVSLNAEGKEEGGSEVDFGTLRVGDFASQIVKVGNKGKYKIGYKFILSKPSIAALVAIEPAEGTIEPGAALAEVKLTFCAKIGETLLKANRDVKVQISEPTTGEIVETFPLYLNANAKFNKFRIQPSKGISFGSVRFDAAAKTKRVEIRNEGQFDCTFVVCAKAAEVDELDALDAAVLSAYAFGIPAALRPAELGDGYMERLGKGGAAGKAAPPAKGKDAKGAAAAPVSGGGNPLVTDPDGLVAAPAPDAPLVVGAFSVSPRIGSIAPGQVVGIDIKFDPAGCDVSKEKLRICYSGADIKDTLTQTIRSFELSGDSCFPAIVNDDVLNIFEEQEVVKDLAGSVVGGEEGDGGAAGKIDKLPPGKVVYAETEKLLAFGPVLCGMAGAKGVMERIRITNPTKVDTKVRFKIVSAEVAAELAAARGGAAAPAKGGGKDAKAPAAKGALAATAPAPEVFSVQPEVWDIPPHEHRFVSIYFNPTEIKSYKSVFLAEVDLEGAETSAKPKGPMMGNLLQFDVGGSGTLPTIAVERPTERGADGTLSVDLGKTHIHRASRSKLVLRNGGSMSATCLFDMQGDDDFSFAYSNSSLTVAPGEAKEIPVSFLPKKVHENPERNSQIKISVLNNAFDQYHIRVRASAYACDAVIDTLSAGAAADPEEPSEETKGDAPEQPEANQELVTFPELNLAEGPASSTHTILLRSSSAFPIKFDFNVPEGVPKNFVFTPSRGHLGPKGAKEIVCTFKASEPVKVEAAAISVALRRIEYKADPAAEGYDEDAEAGMRGCWDDSMKNVRDATEEDLVAIDAASKALAAYLAEKAAEEAKGKKGKAVGPPPEACRLVLGEMVGDVQTICETIPEPYCELVAGAEPQMLNLQLTAVADVAKYKCEYDGENIPFKPTYLFQSTSHKFTFTNECNISLPLQWAFDDMKRRGTTRGPPGTANTGRALQSRVGTARDPLPTIPCPFSIEPETATVAPKSEQIFTLKFQPIDSDDFIYALRGETLPSPGKPGQTETEEGSSPFLGPARMVVRGSAKRPVCHFELVESPDYLARRPSNMKNENGLFSPIEGGDVRVVELESTGLKTRNTFRFHIINPTSENYEFIYEAVGDPSPFWRCVQSAGMLFGGKRIEIVFEYLPEETSVAESFFRFRLPKVGLEQLFLFSGKVKEPRVFFATSRMDFHSVMLGGEGSQETVYLENKEHLPFNFAFDKMSLLQLEGTAGPVLDIVPKQGTVQPNGRVPISFLFRPQEEVVYNFNLVCEVKRKPNKLSINVKGEGYAVHPVIQLEQSEDSAAGRFLTLRPSPAVNYADFGSVQVLDTLSKTITVSNNGKYNFDYLWDTENIGAATTLAGGKYGGTLHKGETMSYTLTFAPQKEMSLDGSLLAFTVAGKYTYELYCRGSAVSPALRFSFMQHDFGPCFVTSPGGSTVVEEQILRLVNHDPTNNINVECQFQKTRALSADCPPTVLEPGASLDVPIRFAPRDVKDYTFVVPFVINGTSRVNVMVLGKGISARLEMVTASQRRTNFGVVNVGGEGRKTVALVNRSKRALPVQLIEDTAHGLETLADKCVSYFPTSEFVIAPRETATITLAFNPTRRLPNFTEDLLIRYAGVTRKLLTVSGKAQGVEVALETDSLPFGSVVIDSQKVRKLTLENGGDVAITYNWMAGTFGKHFSIAPLSGKLLPNSEVTFDVTFKPCCLDEDINQGGMMLLVPGLPPLTLTCTGACIPQPEKDTQTLQFNSLARKAETKSVKMSNPTDKDWYLSPSLNGNNWKIPPEFKVPAKASADMSITYFPLTMAPNPGKEPAEGEPDPAHKGQLFVSLPDGTAQLYKLRGYAAAPECSGQLSVETSAKKPASFSIKVNNWLPELQKLNVTIDITEKPSPATFVIAANAVEVGPNGTKDFPLR